MDKWLFVSLIKLFYISIFKRNMNRSFKQNLTCPDNSERCYFIKPFEIISSYNSFINTWDIVNKAYKKTSNVSDAKLMQALSESSVFGFISYSNWISKKAFIKANTINPVLKYHNVINGNGSNSVSRYLYKLIPLFSDISCKFNSKQSEVFFIESSPEKDNEFKKYFIDLFEKKAGDISSLAFFKAIYRKSKFRFIFIIDHKDNTKPFIKNNSGDFRIYSSFFKTVKNY